MRLSRGGTALSYPRKLEPEEENAASAAEKTVRREDTAVFPAVFFAGNSFILFVKNCVDLTHGIANNEIK